MTAPVPTRPGWWWRKRVAGPEVVQVHGRGHRTGPHYGDVSRSLWFCRAGVEDAHPVEDDGQWLREVCPRDEWNFSPVESLQDCDGYGS